VLPRRSTSGLHPAIGLEALKGDLKGYQPIRVNERWRIVFRWEGNNAHAVRLIDYHK
jgi:toxin HigB-1